MLIITIMIYDYPLTSYCVTDDYFLAGWWGLHLALSLVNGTWVWDKNILDPLTYDLWADGQPSLDGECGNFYGSGDGFGLNDHPCTNLEGYTCEDVHCYLL